MIENRYDTNRPWPVLRILFAMAIILSLVGCNGGGDNEPENQALQNLWKEAPEGTVAILINHPTEQQLNDYPATDQLTLDSADNMGEQIFVIPGKNVSTVTIYGIEFQNDDFNRADSVYQNTEPKDSILDLRVMRPEGGPHYELALKGDFGEVGYYFAYNGKDGNPNIEYILKD